LDSIKGWIKDLLIAALIALLIMTFIKPTIVKESSMQPTLYANNYIFLSKQSYKISEPKRGDIVVFHSDLTTDDGREKFLIKRIIGLPGETVTIAEGQVYIDDQLLSEPYINDDVTPGYIENFVVPEGEVFVLGDNRVASRDSRDGSIGCVQMDLIVGKAFFRLYPFNMIGVI